MYTGERVTELPMLTVTRAQGMAAYQFVSRFTRERIVLDVGCGDGYGAAVLAATSRAVVAVDRDAETVETARRRYGHLPITFVRAESADLPVALAGQRFDVVCSLQFIEHLADQAGFLRLLRGLARPDGLVAISTPNTRVFPSFNPYHAHEFDLAEFRALLGAEFPSLRVFGVFGDAPVLRYRASKQRIGALLLRLDVLRARVWLPRPALQRVYDLVSFLLLKRVAFWRHRLLVTAITPQNFSVREDRLAEALDFIGLAGVAARPNVPSARAESATAAAAVAKVSPMTPAADQRTLVAP